VTLHATLLVKAMILSDSHVNYLKFIRVDSGASITGFKQSASFQALSIHLV